MPKSVHTPPFLFSKRITFSRAHSGHFYVRGVTPYVASKANDGKKSVFTKKGPKYSLGFML